MDNDLFSKRFQAYFDREVAQRAAHTVADGSEIEFHVAEETFTFTRQAGKNAVLASSANEPHLIFTLTPAAAETILSDTSEEIGVIGVNILKLLLSPDANRRVSVKIKAGFLTLFAKGYFGVITTGGAQFASFLASKGFDGIGAIKSALKKARD